MIWNSFFFGNFSNQSTVSNCNSFCCSYNCYFYLCIKFHLWYFTFYIGCIGKFLLLRQLNMSLIHIKLPTKLACFGKSYISLNCLKPEFWVLPSLCSGLLMHSFFIHIHRENLCFIVQKSCLYSRHFHWDTYILVYNL